MKLKFFSYDTVEILKTNILKNVSHYSDKTNEWIGSNQSGPSMFLESKIDIPDEINLLISDKPEKDDFQNIKILYSSLKNLTNCQASDERVWCALCHGLFWNYMRNRWPVDKCAKDKKKYILKNYFFAHGTRSLITNGLARLWWFGYITYQEGESDPYYLTEYICRDINGKGFPLLGSNFSNNRKTTAIFLKTIKTFEESNKKMLSRTEFLEMVKLMNLLGGKQIIDSIPEDLLVDKLIKKLKTFQK